MLLLSVAFAIQGFNETLYTRLICESVKRSRNGVTEKWKCGNGVSPIPLSPFPKYAVVNRRLETSSEAM